MRSWRKFMVGVITCGALTLGGAVAHADAPTTGDEADETTAAPEPPVAVDATSVTLPLFGAPLTVDVTTDAGGGLVEVALNPADDYTATKVKPNRVRFVNGDESARVHVSAKRGGERVGVKAGSLDDVTGPGGWSGDVFGDGTATTVSFQIGADDDGSPTISGVAVDSSAEFEIGELQTRSREDDDRSRIGASVKIVFNQSGQTRTLTIKVGVGTRGDESAAHVKIKLSRVRGRQVVDGEAIGTHTWNGVLCDGTAASITYTVGDDGTISGVTATPEAEVREGRHVKVSFSRGERVSIKVSNRGGEMTVGAKERIRCNRTDAVVNTEVDDHARDGDDDRRGKRDRGNRNGDHGGKRRGGD